MRLYNEKTTYVSDGSKLVSSALTARCEAYPIPTQWSKGEMDHWRWKDKPRYREDHTTGKATFGGLPDGDARLYSSIISTSQRLWLYENLEIRTLYHAPLTTLEVGRPLSMPAQSGKPSAVTGLRAIDSRTFGKGSNVAMLSAGALRSPRDG